jgi:hypothetical protein
VFTRCKVPDCYTSGPHSCVVNALFLEAATLQLSFVQHLCKNCLCRCPITLPASGKYPFVEILEQQWDTFVTRAYRASIIHVIFPYKILKMPSRSMWCHHSHLCTTWCCHSPLCLWFWGHRQSFTLAFALQLSDIVRSTGRLHPPDREQNSLDLFFFLESHAPSDLNSTTLSNYVITCVNFTGFLRTRSLPMSSKVLFNASTYITYLFFAD